MTSLPHQIEFLFGHEKVTLSFAPGNAMPPTTTVLNYLRALPGFTGTKEGCAEGDCGACTVVLAVPEGTRLKYLAVDSCLIFLPMLHGCQLLSIEHLSEHGQLHPVQQHLLESGGSQCGFCTPGVAMSLFALSKTNPTATDREIKEALTGNLCRCTGYRPILEAAHSSVIPAQPDHFCVCEAEVASTLNHIRAGRITLQLESIRQCYYKPFSLEKALRLRKEFPEATLINGASDVALRQTKKHEQFHQIIDLSSIEELQDIRQEGQYFWIGAGARMEAVKIYFENLIPSLGNMLHRFGSRQIRNVATLGGNVCSASPIGDSLPLLMALGSYAVINSLGISREIMLDDFITGYRQTDLHSDELLTAIKIPIPQPDWITRSYKISKRQHLDISTLSAAVSLKLSDGSIADIRIAYGGMDARPRRAPLVENCLIGKPLAEETFALGGQILQQEFTPIADARSGSAYRQMAAANLLVRYYHEIKPHSE